MQNIKKYYATIYLQAERLRDFVREKRTYNIDENYKCLETPVKTCKIMLMQQKTL